MKFFRKIDDGEYESSIERNVGKLEKASLAKNNSFRIFEFGWLHFNFDYSRVYKKDWFSKFQDLAIFCEMNQTFGSKALLWDSQRGLGLDMNHLKEER